LSVTEVLFDNYVGSSVKESCPECQSPLLRNKKGNVWCSNMDCNYHIRNGKRVRPIERKPLRLRSGFRVADILRRIANNRN
jgi:uncharacterized Zn finger protein (UPF0148 family)